MKTGARRLFAIWFAAAILTSLTSYGEPSTIDALTVLDAARPLAVGKMPILQRMPGQLGTDGRIYTQYAPANTIVLVPAVWAGAAVERLGYSGTTRTLVEEFVTSQIAAGARAGVAVLVFVLLNRLRPNRPANIGLAMLSLFAAFDSQYGRTYYSETMVQLGVLGAAIGLLDLLRGSAAVRRHAGVIGGCCALSVAFRYETAVFVPIFAALLWQVVPEGSRRTALTGFAIPVVIAATLMGAFNAVRFGAPWITGYPSGMFVTTPWIGWAGILASPGAGLLWFAPITFVLLLPVTWKAESGPAESLLRRTLLALLVVDVLVCGSFYAWSGSAWGPRFLAVLMPLVFVCVFDAGFKSVTARRISGGLAAAGVAMNLLLLVAPYERYQASAAAVGWTNEQRLWSIDKSPLLNQPRLAREVLGNLGDLDRFAARATARLDARGTSGRFNPENPLEMLQTSVLLNVPALWWFKATLAGVPGWVSGMVVVFGLLAAAGAIGVAVRENQRLALNEPLL